MSLLESLSVTFLPPIEAIEDMDLEAPIPGNCAFISLDQQRTSSTDRGLFLSPASVYMFTYKHCLERL